MTHTGIAASDISQDAGSAEDATEAVRSVAQFTADLYRRLAATPGNLVCSPYSVAVALAMTRNGARGRTADEMDAVLHAGPLEKFNSGMTWLDQTLESRAGNRRRADRSRGTVSLDTANSLWGQQDTTWVPGFLDALAADFGAGMRLVDYQNDATGATKLINAWTSQQTHDKIPEIIPPKVLDELTRLVLVNAIYFKAPWEEPFEKTATSRQPFVTEDGSSVKVDMMSHDMERAAYASGPNWRAARLAYVGGDIAMALVVPEEGTALKTVEESLDGLGLTSLLDGFRAVTRLRVEMPRWTFRTAASLNDPLAALGMPTAFDENHADFSGMTTQEQLYISHVLHQAFIGVDEEGTEAAAATAVVMGTTSAPAEPPLTVSADRAFLFVLFDVETKTPLFIGRVSDPTAGPA